METKVVHSQSKNARNVVGDTLGEKYKIARCPYMKFENSSPEFNNTQSDEALEHANFISECFNNIEAIKMFLKKL